MISCTSLEVCEYGMEKELVQTHQLFVPGLVGRRPPLDVVDDVKDKESNKEKGTGTCPHDLPIPVGTMTEHVFYVFLKPKMS